ncbi:hypothetical protein FISHEDRAFT_70066 [Fistulina hepatica ATCC 64428]|uniref:ABC transporter domain-containing protein n=1 Tax=Fistulina hepatica ATCC 64428 TaxID=1128425 RepID=A0A0D7AKI8_9AGAR|nr:hypothetical protein FISHEDRAFT_70066 [Fistulina hepatica ATCC 64428]
MTTSVTSAHHAIQHPESDGSAHDFSSDDGLFNLETLDAARDALPTHSLASFSQSVVDVSGLTVSVSLAHAVYSRASVLLLDDVLSAVDAQTAYHLYHQCLQEDIMKGRTVLLVLYHVHLCTPGAAYIVALDNGHQLYSGAYDGFQSSGAMGGLVQSIETAREDEKKEKVIEEADVPLKTDSVSSSTDSSATVAATPAKARKPPCKLVEDEKRAVGHISHDIWEFKDLTKHLEKVLVEFSTYR